MRRPKYWLYKCNSRNEDYQSGYGDWVELFNKGEAVWGGLWSTKNARSRQIILNEMKPKDLVFCYQTDRHEMVGMCRLVRFVNVSQGVKKGRNLRLKAVARFDPPIKIHALKQVYPGLRQVRCLIPGPVQAIYDVDDKEAELLIKVCGATAVSAPASRKRSEPRRSVHGGGAGFGNSKQNRKVEERAIGFVTARYKAAGWGVRSREKDNVSYDLECRRGNSVEHVEVKGASGEPNHVIVTAGEYGRLQTDPRAVLTLVGNALSRCPTFERVLGRDVQHKFAFEPLSFVARRQT